MQFKEWLVGKTYYHGSNTKLQIGTILRPQPSYEQNWGGNSFYQILDKYRPPNMISHKNAVFMVDNLDDLDDVGASDAFVYKVMPLGPVQKHDLNWSSEIDMLTSDEEGDENMLKKAAMYYWWGKPHYNASVWEYLTTYAVIVALVEEN